MPDGRELLLTKGRMRNLNFYGALGLSTLSGCLWFLAVTPFDFSLLAWIAAVPMFMAVERAAKFSPRAVSWAGGPDSWRRPADFTG